MDESRSTELGDHFSDYIERVPRNKKLIEAINRSVKLDKDFRIDFRCMTSERVCSICGKDIATNFCAHRPWEIYFGKLCGVGYCGKINLFDWGISLL